MADPTVDVSYSNNTFTFDPDTVRMNAAGTIILRKKPQNADWKFTNAKVKQGGGQFRVTVPASGQTANIRDDHTSLGTWDYNVTIDDDGTSITSPDPQIINENPPQMKTK